MKKNYVKELDTFLFRRSWGELILSLSDEDAGKIIKGLYRFANGEDTPPEKFDSYTLASVYSMIRNQLNYSARRFTEKVERCNAERELKE